MTSRTRRNLLSVEVLEDRSVPAAITVTTLNDTVAVDGLVSLREAVQSINGGPTSTATWSRLGRTARAIRSTLQG